MTLHTPVTVSLNGSALAALIVCAAAVLTSCEGSGDPLPGGYSIFVASNNEIFLEEPKYGGSIPGLGTDLEKIGNHKELIFGLSGSDRGSTSGYFLLNTRDGSIKTGLGHKDWLSLTKAAGIPSPPALVSPTRKSPRRR